MSNLKQAKKLRNKIKRWTKNNEKYVEFVFLSFYKELNDLFGTKFNDDIPEISYKKFSRNMRKSLSLIYSKITVDSADYINDLFSLGIKNAEISVITNRLIKRYAKNEIANSVKHITKSTKLKINKIISSGLSEGINSKDIVKDVVLTVKDMSGSRAKTIVRTEISKVVNITQGEMSEYAGMTHKTWLYTHISKTQRKAHVNLNNKKIKINEKFNINGHEGKYPHDSNLPPSEIINCECSVIYK